MDTTKKFDGLAKEYTLGRPGYASELIDCMYSNYGVSKLSVIADIGSGTGKFARHLLERGGEVYCVEPNEDMRCAAENELRGYANFHSVRGTAEDTTLGDDFADCITAAQAFHWFDTKKFKQECTRIIKNNGKVFLIWNFRDPSDAVNQDLHEIYSRYCPNFKGFGGGIEQDDPRIKEFFDGKYDYVSFDNPLYFDKDKFIARCLSSSYSLKEGDRAYREYIEALETVFKKHSRKDIVSVGNQSVAYIGTITKSS